MPNVLGTLRVLVSVATGVMCGTAPALQAGRVSLVTALRERAPSGGGVRLRRALVVGQIAFTLLLLICAGLFLQTVSRLQDKGPGFDSDRLLMFQVDAAKRGYDDAAGSRLVLQLLDAVRNTPGVASAAIAGHGVMSFVVTQRTREIGIRLALGATGATAVWLVVRDALLMVVTGTTIALLAGWALARVISGQLFGVAPIDAPTIALATTLLAIVALGATAVPAWRASSVSPTEALHAE